MSFGKVSVIVPVYNSHKTIGLCLDALLKSDFRDIEVICADDGSRDRSCDIIGGIASLDGRVRLLRLAHAGPAFARNAGVAASSGNILFFVDSDVIVEKDTITKLLSVIDRDGIACAGGMVKPHTLDTCYDKFQQQWYSYEFGSISGKVYALPTSNLMVVRAIFDSLGGFDVAFRYPSAEDYDFCYRVIRKGYFIYYRSDAAVTHLHPQCFGDFIRRPFLYQREAVKLRLKSGSTLTNELAMVYYMLLRIKSCRMNYLPGMRSLGMLWDFFSFCGQISGVLRYAFFVKSDYSYEG